MSEIKVIDNFLNYSDFKNLKDAMVHTEFPWFFNNTVVFPDEADRPDCFQFIHPFYNHVPLTSHFNLLTKLLENLNPFCILRIKGNLLTRTERMVEYASHVDYFDNRLMSAIFYINTNDGYTIFQNGKKIESIENRIAIFPSNLYHAGTSCTDQKRRIVININYYEHEGESVLVE